MAGEPTLWHKYTSYLSIDMFFRLGMEGIDRTREFFEAALRANGAHSVPRLFSPPMRAFSSAAAATNECIWRASCALAEARSELVRREALVECTRVVSAVGRDITSLDNFAAAGAGASRERAAHQKGVVAVLTWRLHALSTATKAAAAALRIQQQRRDRVKAGAAPLAQLVCAADGRGEERRAVQLSAWSFMRLAQRLDISSLLLGLDVQGVAEHNHDQAGAAAGGPRSCGAVPDVGPAPAPDAALIPGAHRAAAARTSVAESTFIQSPQPKRSDAGSEGGADFSTRQHAQELRMLGRDEDEDAASIAALEQSMNELSALTDVLATKLVEQSEDVSFVFEAAVATRGNLRDGNKELDEVVERPNTLRDFAVAVLIIMAATLLFLDYFSRP